MSEHDLSEIFLRTGEERIRLRRVTAHGGSAPSAALPALQSPIAPIHPHHPPASVSPAPAEVQIAAAAEPEDAGLAEIVSPMVGTVYTAPEPMAPPFVNPGSRVSPNTTVCLIEAMKVFNEIKAEVSGVVEKVLIKDEDPVEYGQPLFLVRPE